jgi:hypothetical protein
MDMDSEGNGLTLFSLGLKHAPLFLEQSAHIFRVYRPDDKKCAGFQLQEKSILLWRHEISGVYLVRIINSNDTSLRKIEFKRNAEE